MSSAALRRFVSGAVAAAAVVGVVGCGPSGPGALSGRVTGDGLGAVVLEVTGTGIQSFEATGSTQVYAAPLPGSTTTHRVVLVSPEGGRLDFRMNVDDRDMEGPVVTVVEAASTTNEVMAASIPVIAVER